VIIKLNVFPTTLVVDGSETVVPAVRGGLGLLSGNEFLQ
jgi:hypothetical protein